MQLTVFDRIEKKIAQSIMLKPKYLRLKRGVLSICFDDFPHSAWAVAGPVLAHYGVHATYFASGGLCNQINNGIQQFTDSDLQEISLSGHELGCHTFDHVSALKVPLEIFKRSIQRNRKFFIERLESAKIESFAFPYNHVTIGSKLLVARRFKLGRGAGNKLNDRWFDLSEMSAINLSLTSSTIPTMGKVPLFDLPYLIDQAAMHRKWLVVYTHDVGDNPSEHGSRTRDFEKLIIQAKSAGLDIKPVREVLSYPMDLRPCITTGQSQSA
ncbi:polysaccharide deacetylase family protein [Microvirga sp. 2TAF3]|uniref:polysaccharide deacetylase family protein n=1 Tax=Microvirga sp. 2TAF3 TaxID=3233014 RepID=UPI003F9EAA42